MNFARRTSCNRCGRGIFLFFSVHVRCFIFQRLDAFVPVNLILTKNMYALFFTDKTTEAKMMKAGGTEIGKTFAEKSRGLFSANDWQCKTY